MKKLKADELNRKTVDEFKSSGKIPVCIVLDNVRSMLNVGSVFRTCDAFIVEKLYLCGITAQPPHREIQKTALGATETVDWKHHTDVLELTDKLKHEGWTVLGIELTDKAQKLNEIEIDQNKKYALILGNEVDGLSEGLLEKLDQAIEIPQHGMKHSLNVSVAAGIVIYKFFEAYL
jgi:tRNA G18 (ribose-2'-O)-methylase SpoU